MSDDPIRQVRRVRCGLYRWARLLGDVTAAADGKLPQRLVRKRIYRGVNGALARLLRDSLR